MNKIKALRQKLGWTQEELADQAGVEQEYISRLEKGKFRDPSARKVAAIARALGVTVEDLIGDDIPVSTVLLPDPLLA